MVDIKFAIHRCLCTPTVNVLYRKLFKRNYNMENFAQKKPLEEIHPYKKLHPWKSLAEFSYDLVKSVFYNEDGLVALNKPYGVSHQRIHNEIGASDIPNFVDYTLEDALPHIAKQLNYSNLIVVKKPEKYMTGITLLAADSKIVDNVKLALRRGNNYTSTYWALTIRVPNKLWGEEHLAIKMKSNPHYELRKPIIVTSWPKNEQKRGDVKILNVKFRVLSNSTFNLSSLVQIKSSTIKHHAIRLFAATFLYCPILGDNIHGSRIQKIGGTYITVDPFVKYTDFPPKLDKELLQLLKLNTQRQPIIPVHIHFRSINLPYFHGKERDLLIEAPLIPPFEWTYQQLKFDYLKEDK
ncbi:mitochondrial RNA pseudouridine synthase RPUSD4-like [Colletes gigas]|uniref:mitochondrial RNA pseudouridine synthase RPUSD4-like n=1 Tax=Colletes gigas TaxID=935657 RepID=UPI001C9A3608|nr:mitochondrial RNA pseudouridine synthase RPUSD4-like [Colletes gigas]